MINVFKVEICTRRRRHTWSGCPYAHLGETAKRRDPNTYHAVPCPEMKQGNRCPRRDQCPYSHHDFEYWLHPARYCTVMCNKGAHCDRSLCFFAHSPEELRSCPASVPNDANGLSTLNTDTYIHGSSASSDAGVDKCCDLDTSSLTSVAESFRSTYDRFQEPSIGKDSLTTDSEYPAAIPNNSYLSNIEASLDKLHPQNQASPVTARAQRIGDDIPVSSNICQLLSTPTGPVREQRLPSDFLLQRSFSVGQTHHSPTNHFSGIAAEFNQPNRIQTLPSCPPTFDFLDMNSATATNGSGMNGHFSVSTPGTFAATPHNGSFSSALNSFASGCNQEISTPLSLQDLNQSDLLRTEALQNFTSAPSLFGGPNSEQDIFRMELLLNLQTLYNLQGDIPTSPLLSSVPVFNSGLSSGDHLYSLSRSGSDLSNIPQNGFFP